MKAIRVHRPGPPEVLRYDDVPTPEPGPGEVLLRVHAAGLNPPDWYARGTTSPIPEALRPKIELPFTPGSDASGVVERIGPGVQDFQVGDDVFGMVRFPTPTHGGRCYAQYTTSPVGHLARKPREVDHTHAAAVPMSALTAWQYLFKHGSDPARDAEAARLPWCVGARRPLDLTRGKVVLVNGAAGGVGHFAVQFAKTTGATVIGVASGRHEAFVRALGADQFIDYTKASVDMIKNVDVVIDTVGGPLGYRFLDVLKPGGILCPVFLGEYHPTRAAELGITIQMGQVYSSGEHMAEIARLAEQGVIRAGIDSVYPLADARLAHERAERGHIEGKIVLDCM